MLLCFVFLSAAKNLVLSVIDLANGDVSLPRRPDALQACRGPVWGSVRSPNTTPISSPLAGED